MPVSFKPRMVRAELHYPGHPAWRLLKLIFVMATFLISSRWVANRLFVLPRICHVKNPAGRHCKLVAPNWLARQSGSPPDVEGPMDRFLSLAGVRHAPGPLEPRNKGNPGNT